MTLQVQRLVLNNITFYVKQPLAAIVSRVQREDNYDEAKL